jgi:hypothetical protein
MATATKLAGNKEGNGKGGKIDGDGNEGGGGPIKWATASAGRAIVTAMRKAGNKEGNGKGRKSNGNSNGGYGQAMTTMAMAVASTRAMATATRWWARDGDNVQGSKDYSDSHEDGRRQRG